ncbi:hypothetical protein BDW75DRAFT_207091 [Aspergillus navahoensis]
MICLSLFFFSCSSVPFLLSSLFILLGIAFSAGCVEGAEEQSSQPADSPGRVARARTSWRPFLMVKCYGRGPLLKS